MASYMATNWYWVVAADESNVWSSKAVAFISPTDETYQAFLAAGDAPTMIDSVGSLSVVMQDQWLPAVLTPGVAAASKKTPALDGTYDPARVRTVSNGIAAGKPLPGGGQTFFFIDVAGGAHEFTSAQFLGLAEAIEDYGYDMQQAMLTRLNGGSAALPTQPVDMD